jgi:hypothetical protein
MLERKLAYQRLDNALLILSSVVNVVFAFGNSAYGSGFLAISAPLYLIAWAMPVWSGYFLGAILRKNLIDRIRGWIYILAGVSTYFFAYAAILWIPLPLGPSQLDPFILHETVLTVLLYNLVFLFFALILCKKLVRRLFGMALSQDEVSHIDLGSKAFRYTYVATYFFGSMSILYIWDALRRVLSPEVISVELLMYAGVACFLAGLLFEALATKATKNEKLQTPAAMCAPTVYGAH